MIDRRRAVLYNLSLFDGYRADWCNDGVDGILIRSRRDSNINEVRYAMIRVCNIHCARCCIDRYTRCATLCNMFLRIKQETLAKNGATAVKAACVVKKEWRVLTKTPPDDMISSSKRSHRIRFLIS